LHKNAMVTLGHKVKLDFLAGYACAIRGNTP